MRTHFMNDCKFAEERSEFDGEIYTVCYGISGEIIFRVRGTYKKDQRLSIFGAIMTGYQNGCIDGNDDAKRDMRTMLGITS